MKNLLPPADTQLRRDLWPKMRERLDERTIAVSRFDWALIAAVLIWIVVFPQSVIALLYHL